MAASWRQVTLLRAEIYRFLGDCMLEPFQADRPSLLRPDFWRDFPLGPANGTMRAALDKLVAITAGLATLPRDAALQKVRLEYAALFLGFGEPQAPPWESMYRTTERFMFGSPAYRVRTAMLQFGVAVAANYRQPEDHLGLELMLLAAASDAAAAGEAPEWRESARQQAEFIATHPLGWIADLERDASAYGSIGFYAALIGLIRGVLLWDAKLLGEYVAAASWWESLPGRAMRHRESKKNRVLTRA